MTNEEAKTGTIVNGGRIFVLFAVSRIVYLALGVRFDDSSFPKIQHYIDPVLLRSDLFRSLFYLHSQPPLYNLFLGVVSKFAPGFTVGAFVAMSWIVGFVLAWAMAATAVRMGVPGNLAFWATALFIAGPASVLYENYLFYSHPAAAMLAVAALALHGFASEGKWRDGALFFGLLSAIVWTRSLFHLVWMIPGLLLVLAAGRKTVRTVVLFSLFFVLAGSLPVKNYLLFGFFGSSSWLGMSAARMTVFQIPRQERQLLIDQGKLSPISRIQTFSAPEVYEPLTGAPRDWGVPVLDERRKSTGEVNFNHSSFPSVARLYEQDARRALRERPGAYLRVLVDSFYLFFQPPQDFAPFEKNRREIGVIDRFYDFLVYGQLYRYEYYPTLRSSRPVLHFLLMAASTPWLYVAVFGLVLLRPVRWALGVLRKGDGDAAVAATVLFLAGNVLWVMVVGNLLEVGENNRFRFLVEPGIFVLAAFELSRWLGWNPKAKADWA